jgi:hypothetical protein
VPVAWAETPKPTIVGEVVKAVAVVESVDPTTREVLLSGPEGKLVTVVAGPEIRNFAQIKAGDRLYLTFRKAVAVQLAPSGQPLAKPEALVGARRAALGQLPAGAGFVSVAEEVSFISYEHKDHIVTFTDSHGVPHAVELHSPAMQKFAAHLKKGDTVLVNFLQSVSIKLRPDPAS